MEKISTIGLDIAQVRPPYPKANWQWARRGSYRLSADAELAWCDRPYFARGPVGIMM